MKQLVEREMEVAELRVSVAMLEEDLVAVKQASRRRAQAAAQQRGRGGNHSTGNAQNSSVHQPRMTRGLGETSPIDGRRR